MSYRVSDTEAIGGAGRPPQPRRRRHREPRRRRPAAHRPRSGRHGRAAGDLRRDHRPPHGRRPVGARPPARHQLRGALPPHARGHGLAADGPRAGAAPVEGEPRRQRPRARRRRAPGCSSPRAATPTTAPRRSTSPSSPNTPSRGPSCPSTWPPSASGPTTCRPSTIPPAPGRADPGDPFGGAGGANQARLVPGGPVTVYAPGFRNPYDVVLTAAGRLYTVDNGANPGWGDAPGPRRRPLHQRAPPGRGPPGRHLPLPPRRPGTTAGTPTRPGPTPPTPSPASPRSPTPMPGNATFRPGEEVGGAGDLPRLHQRPGGVPRARCSAGRWPAICWRPASTTGSTGCALRPDGRLARKEILFDDVGQAPLDVTTRGDGETFPGTIWVGDVVDGSITVFEPTP